MAGMFSGTLALLICIAASFDGGAVRAAEGRPPDLAAVVKSLKTGEKPLRIVCFGDSITGVYYHTGSRRAWCDMLGLALEKAFPKAQIEMINAGVSGHTTENGLARIERDVIAKKPDLVVVKFGMNDVTRVEPEQFQRNVQKIVDRCRGAGAAVVLCTPNAVYENSARPNARLKEFSSRIRQAAKANGLLLVDLFSAWQQIRRQDETGWMLMMSDEIHPNMNGHKRFAELIASRIAGRKIVLGDVTPPADGLQHTFDRLQAGEPVKLIAMPPYDKLMPAALRRQFPDAKSDVTMWPVEGQSLAQMNAWSKRIRAEKPDLVVVAVPAAADAPSDRGYIDNYEWLLNWSFHFSQRPWDVVPILPTVTGPVKGKQAERLKLARRIVIGKDVEFIDRPEDDERSAEELLADWVAKRKKAWEAAKGS